MNSTARNFLVQPAIDVREGCVVRLRQGDYARETRYGPNPLAWAQRLADDGARWLHLVDLDAARHGGYSLLPLLARIVETTGLQVQTGGGVRTVEDVARLLDGGAARVVVGSLAISQPRRVTAWLDRFGGERIVIALDARQDGNGQWAAATHGWTRPSSASLAELVDQYHKAGARHLLCTDIDRDGMLEGPSLDFYRWLRALAPELGIIASGGIRHVEDLAELRAIGCAGAVLGRALLEDRIDLAQAVAC